MKRVKEFFRDLKSKSVIIDSIWDIVWWIDVKRRLLQYSDYEFAEKLFRGTGEKSNLNNPLTFNEKLWFLKLSNRHPLLTKCSDKHLSREYVTECGFSDILKKEYGFYSSCKDIDFASLPSPCYLKCNHASGMNMIYRRERKYNLNHIKWKFDFLLKQNPYFLSREWNYKNIIPGIVCEELIEMPNGEDVPELQFFCFNGKPRFIMYNVGLADGNGDHKLATRWCFDVEYNLIPVKTSQQTNDNPPPKPENFERMLEISAVLSKPFPHVRVDLFNVNGKIYFNEFTFYSGGGFVKLEPKEWQTTLGSWLDVSGYSIDPEVYKKHRLRECFRSR